MVTCLQVTVSRKPSPPGSQSHALFFGLVPWSTQRCRSQMRDEKQREDKEDAVQSEKRQDETRDQDTQMSNGRWSRTGVQTSQTVGHGYAKDGNSSQRMSWRT